MVTWPPHYCQTGTSAAEKSRASRRPFAASSIHHHHHLSMIQPSDEPPTCLQSAFQQPLADFPKTDAVFRNVSSACGTSSGPLGAVKGHQSCAGLCAWGPRWRANRCRYHSIGTNAHWTDVKRETRKDTGAEVAYRQSCRSKTEAPHLRFSSLSRNPPRHSALAHQTTASALITHGDWARRRPSCTTTANTQAGEEPTVLVDARCGSLLLNTGLVVAAKRAHLSGFCCRCCKGNAASTTT
jgi:hypothetical protein